MSPIELLDPEAPTNAEGHAQERKPTDRHGALNDVLAAVGFERDLKVPLDHLVEFLTAEEQALFVIIRKRRQMVEGWVASLWLSGDDRRAESEAYVQES